MKATSIILIAAGAFLAYNLIIVAYAIMTYAKGMRQVAFVSKYAPWLLMSAGMTNYLMGR